MSLTPEQQLASPIQTASGATGLLLSASRELEPGARAMLLLAEDLFRLDVTLLGDTLRTQLRNLSSGRLDLTDGLHPEVEPNLAIGDVSAYQPGQSRVSFSLGSEADRVTVDVIIALLRFVERGTVRITGQAVIRQAPTDEPGS